MGSIKALIVVAVVVGIGAVAVIFVDYKDKIKPKKGPSVIHSPFGTSANPAYKKDRHKINERINKFNKNKERPKKIGF